jgi:uncharacterized protein
MGCIYCIEGNKPTSIKPQTLKFKTVDSLLIALDELKQQGRKLSIMLFGGEPLQKSTLPIIEYLLKKFKESDYKSILFSNSLDALLFKDTIDKYRDIIISYNTTIDGEENYHNGLRNNKKSFKAVVNTIDELVKMNIPINIRTNIGKENLNSIVFLYEFYKKKKWWNNSNISFEIAPLTSHDSANIVNEYTSHSELTFFFKNLVERDSEYLHFNYYGILGHLYYPCRELKLFSFPDYLGYNMSIPRKHGCTIGGNLSFVFTPSGSINNCNEECLSESNRIGSYFPELIWDDNLSGVWTKRDVFSVNRCSICKYKFLCGGGCVRNVIMSNSQNDVLDCSIKSDYESFFPLIVADILRTWIR